MRALEKNLERDKKFKKFIKRKQKQREYMKIMDESNSYNYLIMLILNRDKGKL